MPFPYAMEIETQLSASFTTFRASSTLGPNKLCFMIRFLLLVVPMDVEEHDTADGETEESDGPVGMENLLTKSPDSN